MKDLLIGIIDSCDHVTNLEFNHNYSPEFIEPLWDRYDNLVMHKTPARPITFKIDLVTHEHMKVSFEWTTNLLSDADEILKYAHSKMEFRK